MELKIVVKESLKKINFFEQSLMKHLFIYFFFQVPILSNKYFVQQVRNHKNFLNFVYCFQNISKTKTRTQCLEIPSQPAYRSSYTKATFKLIVDLYHQSVNSRI